MTVNNTYEVLNVLMLYDLSRRIWEVSFKLSQNVNFKMLLCIKPGFFIFHSVLIANFISIWFSIQKYCICPFFQFYLIWIIHFYNWKVFGYYPVNLSMWGNSIWIVNLFVWKNCGFFWRYTVFKAYSILMFKYLFFL